MKTYVLKPMPFAATLNSALPPHKPDPATDALVRVVLQCAPAPAPGPLPTARATLPGGHVAPPANAKPAPLLPPRQPLPTPVFDPSQPALKLGLDVHLEFTMAVAQKDHSQPQAPRKFTREQLVTQVRQWVAEGFRVFCVQESCGFGFTLHRELTAAGAQSFLITPIALNNPLSPALRSGPAALSGASSPKANSSQRF